MQKYNIRCVSTNTKKLDNNPYLIEIMQIMDDEERKFMLKFLHKHNTIDEIINIISTTEAIDIWKMLTLK